MNWKSGPLMGRLFTLGIVLALLLQQVLVAVPVAVAQTAGSAISVTDNSVADWAGVTTWFSDPVGDVSGTGQYDLIKLWLTNTATDQYFRWDVQLAANNKQIATAAYGFVLDYKDASGAQTPDGTADEVLWASFDSQGRISLLVETNLGASQTTLTTLCADSSASAPSCAGVVEQVVTGSTRPVASIEAKVSFAQLNLALLQPFRVWSQAYPSPSFSPQPKDRGPNGSYFIEDPAAGTLNPGPGTGANVTISKSVNRTTVAVGEVVRYTITLTNVGNAPATLAQVVDNLPAGFTYVTGSTQGLTTSNPTIAGQTLTWTGIPDIAAGATVTLSFDALVAAAAGAYDNNASFTIGTGGGAQTTQTGDAATVAVSSTATPDKTAPTSSVSTPAPGTSLSSFAGGISGTASDAGAGASGVAKVEITLQRSSDGAYWNGSAWVATETWLSTTYDSATSTWVRASGLPTGVTLADGSYIVRSRATDNANNVETPGTGNTSSFTIDATAPAAPAVSNPIAPISVNTSSYTIAGTAELGSTVKVWLDANNDGVADGTTSLNSVTADATTGAYSIPVTLTPGANNFVVTATDAAGNQSPANDVPTITLDATAPNAPAVTDPAGPITVGSDSYTITGTAEPGSTVTVWVDANNNGVVDAGDSPIASGTADATTGAYSITVTLDSGANNLLVTATDGAGNQSAATVLPTITLDTTAPNPPTVTDVPGGPVTVTNSSYTITGTAEPGSIITVWLDVNNNGVVDAGDKNLGSTIADANGNYSITVTLPPGANNLLVTATDPVGNQSAPTVLPTITLDTTTTVGAPVASLLNLAPASGTYGGTVSLEATLTAGGSGQSGKTINFTLNGNPVGSAMTNTSGIATLANVSLTGINAGIYPSGVGASIAGVSASSVSGASAILIVGKANQTISFGALADKTYGAAPFAVSATASSGLPVGFAATGNCTVLGSTVTLTGAGSCTVTAAQGGNGNYNPAAGVSRTFRIAAATAPTVPSAPVTTPPAPVTTPPTAAPTTYTLTLSADAGGSAAGGGSYAAGTVATLTAAPADGQVFLGWTIDGTFQGWANPLTITMKADHTAVASFAARPSFPDVSASNPAYEAIGQLAARGIIRGYQNGKFGPNDNTLRAQMAALIARAMGWDAEDHGNRFPDRGSVDANLWRNVGTLAFYDVAKGYQDGSYKPTNNVLNVQVIAFITRAMVAKGYWTTAADTGLYANVPASSGHRGDLATYDANAGAIPGTDPTAAWTGWDRPSTRGWFALAEWQALNSYWGVDHVE